jgi:hypothetical protein
MIRRRVALAAALLVPMLSFSALAQSPPTKRFRGTVSAIDGDTLTLKPFEGAAVTIKLAPNWAVGSVSPYKLTDIKPNDFVGVGASGPDSHLVATQVVVFPEAMRGTGEGHYPWAAQPGNSMTNANVEGATVASSGRELTLAYKGGTVKAFVPPELPILLIGPGDKSMVKPGAKVQVTATVGSDEGLSSNRVTVAINGAEPPA